MPDLIAYTHGDAEPASLEAIAEALFLAPLITRELVYRLWMGELGQVCRVAWPVVQVRSPQHG